MPTLLQILAPPAGRSPRLVDLRNQPADLCASAHGHDDIRGPTAVDFSMLPELNRTPASERANLAAWREQDLSAHYRAQRSNKYR
jgi:hypothetical protein